MKRTLSLILVLVMLLSLTGCGKTPVLADLMNYPDLSASLKDCESFLKGCGYKIESVSDKAVTFTDGYWKGYGYAGVVSLTYSTIGKGDVDFNKEVASARESIQALCGEPYSSRESNQLYKMTTEFYAYDTHVVAFMVNYMGGVSNSMDVTIYIGANA